MSAKNPEKRTAVITASYSNDLERCRLLCESLDANLLGKWRHYILVESADVEMFRTLESPRREIVDERDILPRWLRPFNDPISRRHKRVWLSPFTMPLRGWHVQQLRRFGIGRKINEDLLFSADSDVVLVRKFDPVLLWAGDNMRFYRRDFAIDATMKEHVDWSLHAGRVLHLEKTGDAPPFHDYINTLIGWRRDTLLGLLDHVEKVNGMHWARAIARKRLISECTIYGRYVDDVLAGAGHHPDPRALCHVMWNAGENGKKPVDLSNFAATLEPGQVGVGIQSFIGHDVEEIRRSLAI